MVLPGSLPIVVKIVLLGLLSTEPPVPGGWNWNWPKEDGFCRTGAAEAAAASFPESLCSWTLQQRFADVPKLLACSQCLPIRAHSSSPAAPADHQQGQAHPRRPQLPTDLTDYPSRASDLLSLWWSDTPGSREPL